VGITKPFRPCKQNDGGARNKAICLHGKNGTPVFGSSLLAVLGVKSTLINFQDRTFVLPHYLKALNIGLSWKITKIAY